MAHLQAEAEAQAVVTHFMALFKDVLLGVLSVGQTPEPFFHEQRAKHSVHLKNHWGVSNRASPGDLLSHIPRYKKTLKINTHSQSHLRDVDYM